MAAALLCVSFLGMSGCAANHATFKIRALLATERGPEDVLPLSTEVAGLDVESGREVGGRGSVTYFVAKFTDPDTDAQGVCLILVNIASEFSNSTCGSALGLWTIGSETGGAKVVTNTDEVPDGWKRLGDFLVVNPDATSEQMP